MITKDGFQLYSPKIAKVIYVGRDRDNFVPDGSEGMSDRHGLRFRVLSERMRTLFIPKNSTALYDANGMRFGTRTETVIYDRAHRGKSWFILDLRT